MTGITRVWERLWVGSRRDAEALATSTIDGRLMVITLCAEPVRTKHPQINYVQFPVDDSRPISPAQLEKILRTIGSNVRRGTVLLHCSAGASRSPLIASAWMQASGYSSVEAALTEIATLRPVLDPSPTLLRSIKENLAGG
jgi:atypical dual specificity phosphatase